MPKARDTPKALWSKEETLLLQLLHRDGFNTPASGPFHAEHQGGWPDVPGMAQWRVGGGAGAPRQRIVLASAVTAGTAINSKAQAAQGSCHEAGVYLGLRTGVKMSMHDCRHVTVSCTYLFRIIR